MYEMMELYETGQRRESMLREAEGEHLRQAMRTGRKKRSGSQSIPALAWEVARIVGLLREVSRTPSNAG